MDPKINHYTVKHIPYQNWGIWTDEFYGTKEMLDKYLKKKYKIIKVTKRREKIKYKG